MISLEGEGKNLEQEGRYSVSWEAVFIPFLSVPISSTIRTYHFHISHTSGVKWPSFTTLSSTPLTISVDMPPTALLTLFETFSDKNIFQLIIRHKPSALLNLTPPFCYERYPVIPPCLVHHTPISQKSNSSRIVFSQVKKSTSHLPWSLSPLAIQVFLKYDPEGLLALQNFAKILIKLTCLQLCSNSLISLLMCL